MSHLFCYWERVFATLVRSLGKTLLVSGLLRFVIQGQTYLLLWYLLTS